MFGKAQEWDFLAVDRPNPARAITRFTETARARWLKPAEVEALMQKLRAQTDQYFRAFVPLLLLTGMRKTELLTARWEDVDFDRKEILLRVTKRGVPQVRKLSTPAAEILRFLPQKKKKGKEKENPFIFPGLRKGTHLRVDCARSGSGAGR